MLAGGVPSPASSNTSPDAMGWPSSVTLPLTSTGLGADLPQPATTARSTTKPKQRAAFTESSFRGEAEERTRLARRIPGQAGQGQGLEVRKDLSVIASGKDRDG